VSFEDVERRFTRWAEARPDVRAACVLGSQARRDKPADEWSDLDIVVFADDAERLLRSMDWIREMGEPAITFLEPTATGDGLERRVLYEGGLDVDYSIFPAEELDALGEDDLAEAQGVVARGIRILVDRDGALARLARSAPEPKLPAAPQQEQLDELVNDFWYHAVWAAKKLGRGEVLTAKGAVDSYMKRRLVRLLEWHARAADPHIDTWHDGRFFEEWADPRALVQLRDAFGYYDADDVARALAVTMDLFRWVARETAERLSLSYGEAADDHATSLVDRYLEERRGPP
jgi:aminoglycoside 6-adenylyltransferase